MGVWFSRNVYLPGVKRCDGTAMGVAKVRHTETLLSAHTRLFEDPHARQFVIGAWIMSLMGAETILRMFEQAMPGLYAMLAGRTRFFDDLCRHAEQAGCEQMVVLGAGYDTRGIRLGLQIPCFEVDQAEVQALKKGGLDELQLGERRARLHLVPVDFNSESVRKLEEHPAFRQGAKTVVLLEGVTQYIPKESTAETLRHIQALVGPGSILGVSYVDEATFDEKQVVSPDLCGSPAAIARLLERARAVGEPWMSGWSQTAFASLLEASAFRVAQDVSVGDLEDVYFAPLGRSAAPFLRVERFVKAERV